MRSNQRRHLLVALGLALAALAMTGLWLGSRDRSRAPEAAATTELPRQELELSDGRLFPKSGGGPFTGVMFERAPDGQRLSEVPVRDGQVHGVARGWHANGQPEVEETFEHGVSHGIRTRWHPNGQLRNTATIIRGELHGPYTEWHDNGQLAAKMELVRGKGEGVCETWEPDGRQKSRVVLRDGKPVQPTLAVGDSGKEPAAAP